MRIALLTSLVLMQSSAFADWLQFRGTDTTAVADSPALRNVENDEALKWTADLKGRGLSAPIVIGDRVVVTTCSGLSQERLGVACYSTVDGSQLWNREMWATGRTVGHDKTCNAAPTSASDGEAIYSFYSSGDVSAYDLDGHLLWYRGLGSEFPNASNSLGMSSSLVVVDGTLVCMLESDADSITFGLATETGKTKWQLERPRLANWTSPSLLNGQDGPLVILQSGKGVTAVNPDDGSIAWTWANGASTIPTLTVTGADTLAVPSNGLTVLKPSADEVESLWNSGKLSPATASPVAVGDLVFTLNRAGVVTAASLADGEKIWQLRLKGSFSATPVAAGNRLYAVNEDGLLQVVEWTLDGGEVVSSRDLGDTVLGTPAISNGALYIRSDKHLWKLAE